MAWEMTQQGYMKTTARVTKWGDFDYYGHELGYFGNKANKIYKVHRSKEDLSDENFLKSLNGMPVTIPHPDNQKVDAYDWKNKAVGHIQNPRIEGDYVVCDVYIQDAPTIELLKGRPEIRQVSIGYEPANIVDVDGKLYHKNIIANHLSIVVEGRAGSDCRLNDTKKGNQSMKKRKVLRFIDSLRRKLTDSDGDMTREQIQQLIDDLTKQLEELENSDDEADQDKADQIQQQIDDLKAQLAEMDNTGVSGDTGTATAATQNTTEAPQSDDDSDKDAKIVELQQELEVVKAERDRLKQRVEELEAQNDADKTLSDARAHFPRLNLTDAKRPRDVLAQVLMQQGVYKLSDTKAMTDIELKAAYASLVAMQKNTKNATISKLINDSAPHKRSIQAQLGGK